MQVVPRMLVLLFVLASTNARAQEPGNIQAGRRIAEVHCTQCHALGSGASPHLEAPSFVALANTPGMTGRALAVALQTSHETMPNFVLEREDRDNIVAYIMNLRQQNP
ncbi:MAG: c-type cytochrome [Hyphomicrobiaceae bacterium]